MDEANKRLMPYGGVILPIDKVITITIPKRIGSTPRAIAIGAKTGTNIRIAGTGSINVPKTTNKNAQKNKKTLGPVAKL